MGVAWVVDLRTVRNHAQHIHMRQHFNMIAGGGNTVIHGHRPIGADRYIHEKIDVGDDIALGHPIAPQLKDKVLSAGVLIERVMPEPDRIAFA